MQEKELLEKQKKFVRSGQSLSKDHRLAQLKKLRDLIDSHQEDITTALHKDLKKPKLESFVTEISSTLKEIDHSIKHLSSWMEERKWFSPPFLLPARSKIQKEPFGSTLVIAPWNYPFHLALAPAVASLSAGNSVVIKPSEITSHTEKLIAKIVNQNFDEEILKVVTGGVDVSERLTSLPFDFIFFTGSTAVGKIIMKAASENLVPVCLELGGKSPCVVDSEVDIEVAARRIVWGKFTNAGQTCVAPDFLYVHRGVKEKLLKQIKDELKNFYGENPKDSDDFGRIVSLKHFDRLLPFLNEGEMVVGGESDQDQLYIAPTLIENLSWESAVMKEEIFGPILPIFEFEEHEELVGLLQEKQKPLAFYLFTKNPKVKKRYMNQFSFGGGCINDTLVHLSDPDLPFGGVGASGMGAYHGEAGFTLFSHKKSVVDKSFKLDLSFRYPPYTDKKLSLLKKVLSFL